MLSSHDNNNNNNNNNNKNNNNGNGMPSLDLDVVHSISTNFVGLDTKWVPKSSRLVMCGTEGNSGQSQQNQNNGRIGIYKLTPELTLETITEVSKPTSIRCSTFAHNQSFYIQRNLAVGDFEGMLNVYDLANMDLPLYSVQAHEEIVYCVAGAGGNDAGNTAQSRPSELATGSRNGQVCLWDVRQQGNPTVKINNQSGADCWSVCFGIGLNNNNNNNNDNNNNNSSEYLLTAGFSDGTIKMFDLRMPGAYNSNSGETFPPCWESWY